MAVPGPGRRHRGGLGDPLTVVDADSLCADPERVVGAWCEQVGVPFLSEALTWPSGMRDEWDLWDEWHASTASSTGFEPLDPPPGPPGPDEPRASRPTRPRSRSTRGSRPAPWGPTRSSPRSDPPDYAPGMATPDSTRLAVLIDGDNTTPTIIEALLAEIAKYGSATVKRAYGDWTTPNLRGWKEAINAHAIQPMQQFAYTTGKNATDSALIIDAMDLLYTGNLDGFCLVSSDSDFTKLASRLRESGMTVYGFGEPKTPSRWWRRATSSSTSTCCVRPRRPSRQTGRAARPAPRAPQRRTPAELRNDTKLLRLLRESIDASSDDEGWAHLGGVGQLRQQAGLGLRPRNWGYAKLVDLVTAVELFEVKRASGQGVLVREKPKGQAGGASKSPGGGGSRKATAKSAKKTTATSPA